MTTRKFIGTCQCGRVRYEAHIDFGAAGIEQPAQRGHRTVLIKPNAFHLLSGATDLDDTQFGTLLGHNQACRHCGIRPFGKGRMTMLGGDVYAINVATLDMLGSLPLNVESEARSAP